MNRNTVQIYSCELQLGAESGSGIGRTVRQFYYMNRMVLWTVLPHIQKQDLKHFKSAHKHVIASKCKGKAVSVLN